MDTMLRWTPMARSIQPKFQPVRPGKEDHLKRWTRFFETFPVGPNRSIEFWTEISGKFGWMDHAPRVGPCLSSLLLVWTLFKTDISISRQTFKVLLGLCLVLCDVFTSIKTMPFQDYLLHSSFWIHEWNPMVLSFKWWKPLQEIFLLCDKHLCK